MFTTLLANSSLDDLLGGEALFLGLLGRMVLTYPDPKTSTREWFAFLLEQDVFSEVPLGGGDEDIQGGMDLLRRWTSVSRGQPLDQVMLELQTDSTKLFACVGAVLAPPWESVYFNRKRLVRQEQMLEVRRWYTRYGLVVDKPDGEPDDHVGLELIFVAHLASRAVEARRRGDEVRCAELVAAQRGFLATHLLRWAGLWCDQVQKHATTEYYRGVALSIRGAMRHVAEALEIVMSAPQV